MVRCSNVPIPYSLIWSVFEPLLPQRMVVMPFCWNCGGTVFRSVQNVAVRKPTSLKAESNSSAQIGIAAGSSLRSQGLL